MLKIQIEINLKESSKDSGQKVRNKNYVHKEEYDNL